VDTYFFGDDETQWVPYDDHARIVAGKNAQLADCFKTAGADCDGASDEVIAPRAPRAVRNLRKDYDEACEEADQLRRRCEELEGALQTIRDSTFRNAIQLRSIADRALAARQASAKGGAAR
jgi:hypothetical protein